MINVNFKLIINVVLFYLLFKTKQFFKKDDENEFIIRKFIKKRSFKNLSKKKFEKDLPEIIQYVKLLKENYFINKTHYHEILNPKVSFIATVHNKEKYLDSFISSIQNQDLKEFEIIFVDDFSTDNSIEIINKFKKNDKRISLIKNKNNKGALNSRYKGAIYSKGEYIIFVDSDDIILKKGIKKAYNHIKNFNLDMVEFHIIFDNITNIYINKCHYKFYDIIYQPTLSHVYYYNRNKVDEQNSALWNKLIKKDIVLKTLNNIGENYLNKKIIIENDVIILFSLFKNSNSFQYIDELGYYYFIQNNDSISNTKHEPKKANKIIYSIFTNIEFLYDYTKNTYFHKRFCLFKLIQSYEKFKICYPYVGNEYYFIKNVFNKLLDSKYFLLSDKIIITDIQTKLVNAIKNISMEKKTDKL
jgi:glycosyltransferase involved in cell wall biosynthesis